MKSKRKRQPTYDLEDFIDKNYDKLVSMFLIDGMSLGYDIDRVEELFYGEKLEEIKEYSKEQMLVFYNMHIL